MYNLTFNALKEKIQDEENMLLGMQYNTVLNSFEATRHF